MTVDVGDDVDEVDLLATEQRLGVDVDGGNAEFLCPLDGP
jgi:hypothetical protein